MHQKVNGEYILGIDVHNKRVTINFEHEHLVNTSIETNPTVSKLDDISVHSIFKRKKHRSKHKPTGGDGNPLIYAMKGARDLIVDPDEIYKLLPNFYSILNSISSEISPFVVISMPSSFPFSSMLGSRLARTNNEALCLTEVFRKASFQEAVNSLNESAVHPKDVNTLRAEKRKLIKYEDLQSDFSMKNVKSTVRPAFNPVMLDDISKIPQNTQSITLVDDLLATGTTLRGAARLLRGALGEIEVNAVCIFSPVRRKL